MNEREQALLEQRERVRSRADRKIWVTFRKEGIHKYPAAATDPALATGDEYDVSFLATAHRHIFHFRVWIDVEHSDRAIEFIQFKRWLENLYQDGTLQLDYKSCEMMAEDLYDQIAARYPDKEIWIEVSEDGENGCLIKFKLTYSAQSIKY
jgi:hypothetical protein